MHSPLQDFPGTSQSLFPETIFGRLGNPVNYLENGINIVFFLQGQFISECALKQKQETQ